MEAGGLARARQPGIEQQPAAGLELRLAGIDAVDEAVLLRVAEHCDLLERDRAGLDSLGVDHRLAGVLRLAQPGAGLGNGKHAMLLMDISGIESFRSDGRRL